MIRIALDQHSDKHMLHVSQLACIRMMMGGKYFKADQSEDQPMNDLVWMANGRIFWWVSL